MPRRSYLRKQGSQSDQTPPGPVPHPDRPLSSMVVAWDAAWAEREPDDASCQLASAAYGLLKEGQGAAAIKLCDQAIELCPMDGLLHCARAFALETNGQLVEAIETCKLSIDLEPHRIGGERFSRYASAIAHGYLGTLFSQIGQFDKAIDALFRAINLGGGDIAWIRDERNYVLGKILRPDKYISQKKNDEYKNIMEDTTALLYAVAAEAFKNGLSVAELKEAIEEKLAAKAKVAARETTGRATGKPRPDDPSPSENPFPLQGVEAASGEITAHGIVEPSSGLTPAASSPAASASAEELQWPSEKWEDSPEKAFRKRYAIINYLKRVWNPFIERTGTVVTRDVLKIKDEKAEEALGNYMVNNRNNQKGLERLNGLLILYGTDASEYLASRPVAGVPNTPQICKSGMM